MKPVITLILLLFTLPAFAQQQPEKIQHESLCLELDYCRDCGDKKAMFNGKLYKYFSKELNYRDIDIIEGVIIVQVAVDSTGRACPHAFHNFTTNTSEEIGRLKIWWAIEQMPAWQPAIVNGKPVNSYVLLAIYSKVDGHGQLDVDYLRNDKERKWIVNSPNQPIIMSNGLADLYVH